MKYILTLILSSLILISCDLSEDSNLTNKPVVYAYAKADSTLDSLYLSRYADLDEQVKFSNLAISGAKIYLYEEDILIDSLSEYHERAGIYHQKKNSEHTFKSNLKYSLEIHTTEYGVTTAETHCPSALEDIFVINMQTGKLIAPFEENYTVVDTVLYERGKGLFDNEMIGITFNSNPLVAESRLVSFSLIPDHLEKEYWLEDTTQNNWEEYPLAVQFFKTKKRYGRSFTDYWQYSINLNWDEYYHKGTQTLVIGATDNAFYEYTASQNSGAKSSKWTNVKNGFGLFSISNNSGEKNRYRIYVKSIHE